MDRRPLGNIEQGMVNVGRKSVIHIVQTLIFSSEQPISNKNVERVLHRPAERHPLLRMKVTKQICDGTVSVWFVPMDKINIKMEELPDKVWLDVMNKELSVAEINLEEGPLWHVKFLPTINREETDGSLSMRPGIQHVISNTNSMLHLCNEVLSNLEDELKGITKVEKLESLPLPASLCDIADITNTLPVSLKFCQLFDSLIPYILGAIVRKLVLKDRTVWINKIKNNPSTVPQTGTIPMVFNKSETEKFLNSCKTHSVSPLAAFRLHH